ncbi:MAG TPA: pitrilysin family protein [Pyrinomonadaceae bacterium]|jgi:zinc protease|nr:pitrilysin family protein [Pyrinomonadaceae bacterium]
MLRINKLSSCLALLLSSAFALSVSAQSPQQQQSQTMNQTEEFRRQPPAPLAPRPLNIPTPQETTLANGLQLVIVEDHRLPLVSYRLAFRTGNADDPAELQGLTGIMADMLNEGTETRSSKQIADEVARIGAELSAGANSDYTALSASALSIYGDQIMELMADIALHPVFPAKEFELIRQNRKQGLIQQRAQASFLASERLARTLFGQHPYSRVSTTPEALDAMTREKLAAFHRAMFIPNNAVLVVVGDVRRDEVMRRIEELFGKWAKGTAATQQFPAPPARSTRAIYLVDRPGSAQSNIIIANAGITRISNDYFPMVVMHTVLGATASARLFMNLREAKGYTYGAYSSLDARRSAGLFSSTAEVRTPVTGAALKEFFYELERIRTAPVSDKELNDAKSYLTGVFPIRMETQSGLADQLVQIKMFGLPADYLRTYNERVNAVTARDIQRVAQTYITPDKAAIVIVGDAAAIMEQIKPYAPTVEIYEASGQRRESGPTTASTTTTTTTTTTNADANSGDATALPGVWTLEIQAPGGQTIPATLTVTQEAGSLKGKVQTQMGDGALSDVTTRGNSFDAKLKFGAQGQTLDGTVTGNTESGDRIKGTITLQVPNLPPLPFTGTRARQ